MIFTREQFYQTLATARHQWVTVVNPLNSRMLLQACDDCGVVKSENSVEKGCKASKGAAVISGAISGSQQQAV